MAERCLADLYQAMQSRGFYTSINLAVKNRKSLIDDLGLGLTFNQMRDYYVTYLAMSIRRQAKPDRQSHNLRMLISELMDHAQSFTLDEYRRIHPSTYGGWRARWFRRFSGGGQCLSKAILQNTIDMLTKKSDKIVNWVDKRIAHPDKKKVVSGFNRKEMFECLKYFYLKAKAYYEFIHGVTWSDKSPPRRREVYNWAVAGVDSVGSRR
ncbi:hypothetical protein [Acidihalobacter prosperus]